MSVLEPDPTPPQKGSASWFWACVSCLALLSIFLVTFWIPMPGLAPPPSGAGAQEPAPLLPYHRRSLPAGALSLPLEGSLGEELRSLPVALPAEAFEGLILIGEGKAESLLLSWVSRGEGGLEKRAGLAVELDPSAPLQRIEVPLAGRQAWQGEILYLELSTRGGSFQVAAFGARPADSE